MAWPKSTLRHVRVRGGGGEATVVKNRRSVLLGEVGRGDGWKG